jgi:hypothetical protein
MNERGTPYFRGHGPCVSAVFFPFPLKGGEGGLIPLRGPFGLVFLLCGSLTRPALAGGIDVRSSIQSCLGWNKFRCQASGRLHSSQQGHGQATGNQAAPLASPSPPPVQCPIPGLTYWLFSGLGHFLAKDY